MRRIGMKLHGISLAALALALVAGHAAADDKLTYAPAGDWVKPIVIPKPDPALSDIPLQFLASDTQVHFGADGDSTYNEYALRVQTTQGLQSAQSFVTWNPDYDTVTINKAQIIRGDQIIDLLKSQTYTIARRETNMQRSMLDGMLTGILQPEGLQVGDIVDYGITVRRHDPVFADHSETVVLMAPQVKIGHARMRVTWDKDKAIRYRQSDDLPSPKISTTAAGGEYVVEADNLTAAKAPDEAPDRYSQLGYAEFSQFASWKDISRLMAPYYDKAATLADASLLKAETAKIRAASSDPKVQAAAALNLVETSVRYLFLGMNQGGYIPADADVTWQRRFGDCKGKTALLLALLHDLGIKAEPALVSTHAGDGLDGHLPVMELFDHVIVRAEIDGKVYWLDSTRIGDGNLDTLRVPAWHFALPVSAEGSDLEPLAMTPYDKPETETTIKLDATAGLNVPARAHVEIVYRYDTGLGANQNLQTLSPADRDKALKDYFTGQYSWITPTKVSASFDAATGEERFVMDGNADMAWDQDDKGGGWKYTTDADAIGWSAPLKRDPGPHRDAPMQLNFPNYYVTHEEIDLPKGGKGFTFTGDSFDKTVANTQFHRSASLKGNVFTLDASKRSLGAEVPYAEAMKANDSLTSMWNDTVRVVAPLSYKSGASEPAAVAALGSDGQSLDDILDKAGREVVARQFDQALTDFNQALRQDPTNAKALAGRAFIFMAVRQNYDAAVADYQQAVKGDPTLWTAWNGLGSAYMTRGKYDEAIDAYSHALTVYPSDTFALEGRARAYLATGVKDKAAADANAALDLDPGSVGALEVLASIDMANGKVDDAVARLDKALEGDPKNLSVLFDKADMLKGCGDPTKDDDCRARKLKAIAVYDQVIAIAPSDYAYAMRAQEKQWSDFNGALADIDAAFKLEPKSENALMVRAAIYTEAKDYDKALVDLKQAIADNPKDPEPLTVRERLYLKMDKPDLAFGDFDAALALDPNNGELLNNSCWERATHNYQLDRALADCNAALRITPDSGHILDSRAFVELRLGQYDAAIADYDAALAKEPRLGPSLYGRGIAKLRKGMTADGNADIAAARDVYKGVDDEFKAYGVTP